MGVRGLTSYVESLPRGKQQVWEPYNLCNTKLVIDGNGLYYYLYAYHHLDCKFGGQYGEFEEKAKGFFAKLTSHGVDAYVVFDGVLDETEKKLETIKDRKTERIERAHNLWKSDSQDYNRYTMILPRLTQLTLIKVLQDLKLPYAVADFEADSNIASLANELGGPVLGQDSDYFIFDINEGYIPFETLDFSGPSNTVKRFHSARLAKHLKINSDMLPMLASLIGNDYVSDEMLKPFQIILRNRFSQSTSRIVGIANFLSGCKSLEEAMTEALKESPRNKEVLEKALHLSVAEYQLKQTNLLCHFEKGKLCSKLKTYNKIEIPNWVIKLYREGAFAGHCMSCLCHRKVFLSVQVEDMSKPSANQCALKIRRFLYKILIKYDEQVEDDLEIEDGLNSEVALTEYDRESKSVKGNKIVLELSTAETKVNISNIPTMDKHTKVVFLLNLLSCDLSLVQHLPTPCQLVAAALRYWIVNATPPVMKEHLASLLVYHIGMNDHKIQRCSDVDSLSRFSQWQDVVYWVAHLNAIFGNVFPPLDPVRLYDGVKVCKLSEKLKSHGIEMVDYFVSDMELFKQLYEAVTKELPNDITLNVSRKATGKKSKETKKQNETKTGEKSMKEFLRGNQFAQLCLSSSDTDEDSTD